MGLSRWDTHDNSSTSKITYDGIKEDFLAKEWNSFHLSRKKLYYLHLKDFLKYDCELYLKQPLTPTQRDIIATYRTSNHRLAISRYIGKFGPYVRRGSLQLGPLFFVLCCDNLNVLGMVKMGTFRLSQVFCVLHFLSYFELQVCHVCVSVFIL